MTTGLHLIPAPVSVHHHQNDLALGHDTYITADQQAVAVAEDFAAWLRRGTGWEVPLNPESPGSGVVLHFTIENEGPEEGYRLTVHDGGARLSATAPVGLFRATATLRQLLPAGLWNGTLTEVLLPGVEIVDEPRFVYRGLMLDVARSFFPIPEIKSFISTMAQFKFNVLHLHLADDQSWRIELENPVPNPTGIDFTNLARLGAKGAVNRPGWGLGPGRTGFFTKDEYRDLVTFAAEHFVTIVPEIDVPGHVNAILAAVPELNPDGVATSPNATGEVGFSTLYRDNPLTRPFVAEVFRQLAELTPGPYLHLGGDEALVTSKEDFIAMVTDFAADISAAGKQVMGWNEFAQATLPEGSVIQYWAGDMEPTLHQVSTNGARVVASPGKGSYLDQKYNDDSPIGLKWAAMGDWDIYYEWDPARDGLTESDVLGVEGPLWSETIRSLDEANWLVYPRALALAEKAWSPAEPKDSARFATRLGGLGEQLVNMGITFQPSPDISWSATPADPFEGVDLSSVQALPENAGVADAAGNQ